MLKTLIELVYPYFLSLRTLPLTLTMVYGQNMTRYVCLQYIHLLLLGVGVYTAVRKICIVMRD